MATDADLDHLDSRLNAFAVSNEEHHDSLQSLLQEYQKLLDSHRELRKRLEEQKAPKIEYKEPAKEVSQSPLLPIDRNYYSLLTLT